MKKITIRVLLSVLLVAVVAVGGTLAYLYATDSPLLNTFALADVHTEIDEPDTDVAENKDPKVQNVGKSPVYVRARVVISGADAEALQDKFTFTYNTEYWENGGDEFYYYKGILPANSEENSVTAPLFTGVTVDDTVDKEAQFSVDVYQESVLAPADAKWDLQDAKDAFKAKG